MQLILWDIAGQDLFAFLKPSFLKDSRVSIIVYSLEENQIGKASFEHISDWFDDVRTYCGEEIPIFLFANKVDLVEENELDIISELKRNKQYDIITKLFKKKR